MSLPLFTQSIATAASTLGLLTISHFIFINSADAFSVAFTNGGFEAPISGSQNGWSTTGDVTIIPAIDGISPTNGANQAIITTGYIEGDYSDPIGNRNDDSSLIFNQSGTNPVNADTNVHALQDHLSLTPDAFSIERSSGFESLGPRTSKEGSGMYQQFDVTLVPGEDGFTINFDWSYLTNDGSSSILGEQDFGFWSLGQYDSLTSTYTNAFDNSEDLFTNSDEIVVLKSSSGSITLPLENNNYVSAFDYATNGRYSHTVSGLTPGDYTYRVGFGVVDVDGLDHTSALLIDNIEVVPFEFSPGFGLLFMFGFFGINCYRRHPKISLPRHE